MTCGVVHRHGSDLVLLWLWCRPAAAAAIQTPAWELPYATGAAIKRQKKKKRKIYWLRTYWIPAGEETFFKEDNRVTAQELGKMSEVPTIACPP